MEISWEKPVLVFYEDKSDDPQRKAFLVVKAKKLVVNKESGSDVKGSLHDFFPLMGDVDQLYKHGKSSSTCIVCWMDDREEDFDRAWRRMDGVKFSAAESKEGRSGKFGEPKRTYNAEFTCKGAKLE
ncbi:MAG: hypothetical protein AB1305_00360 [Candidatus Hadarchaeota archaeon]